MSTGGATNRGQVTFATDMRARLDALDQLGVAISDPVSYFLVTTPAAKQGGLVQFKIQSTQGISRVEILRSLYRDSASANIVASYPVSVLAMGQVTGLQDAAPFATGKKLYYWLRAMPIQRKFEPVVHGPFIVTVT